jgi:hypothetical protein
MTTVRIAHAEPRPGNLGNGSFITHSHLVVLADDAGHRAVPIWMRGEPGESDLARLIELSCGPADQIVTAGAPEEVTARLLRAAGASVTAVDIDVTTADIDELSPEVTVARIGLGGPAGARQVTAGLGLGLAMAAAAGAPVRVADAVMDRVAVPVAGDDLLSPLLDWWRNGRAREDHGVTVSGRHDWTRHVVTALIPEDTDIIRFGIGLVGPGRIALRNPELRMVEPGTAVPAGGA